jgi:hypothetical protein
MIKNKKMKKYDFQHFSGQDEIVDFLNDPENENLIPISINNDDRGNWWLIYYEENEKVEAEDQEILLVPKIVIDARLNFLNDAKEIAVRNSNAHEETKYSYAINLFELFFKGMQKIRVANKL